MSHTLATEHMEHPDKFADAPFGYAFILVRGDDGQLEYDCFLDITPMIGPEGIAKRAAAVLTGFMSGEAAYLCQQLGHMELRARFAGSAVHVGVCVVRTPEAMTEAQLLTAMRFMTKARLAAFLTDARIA